MQALVLVMLMGHYFGNTHELYRPRGATILTVQVSYRGLS